MFSVLKSTTRFLLGQRGIVSFSLPYLFVFFTGSSLVLAEDFYWALGSTMEWPNKSPGAVCQAQRDLIAGSTGLIVGDYRIEDDQDNQVKCYIQTKTNPTYQWSELLWYAVRHGDGCQYAYNEDAKECVDKNRGEPDQCSGNPINTLTGYKYQAEMDYNGSNIVSVSFARSYNYLFEQGLWSFSYQQKLQITNFTNYLVVTAFRPEGVDHRFVFWADNGAITSDADLTDRLIAQEDAQGNITGWQLVLGDDTVEEYDAFGKLLSIAYLSGRSQTLSYDLSVAQGGDGVADTLDMVADDLGNMLSFTYDASNRISSIIDPESGVYRYAYDGNGMLQYVSYPDDTPGISGSNPFGEDNPYREYHYEDTNYPAALTGITDETGNRFATWTYDSEGRAISSEHANGTELVTLDYTRIDDATDPRVTVTNELGKDTTYHYTTLHGVRKVTKVEGHASANCAAANQSTTYDANGFLDEVTDWEGNVTDYDHDARGLEVQRIEAKGSPQERTITTQWHADYRLPTKITEPDRVIDFTYDTKGQLLERKETPVP